MRVRHIVNELVMIIMGKRLIKKKYDTVLIDLTISPDDILKQADKNSVRKNIKRAINRGVIIKKVTSNTLEVQTYSDLLYFSRKILGIEKRTKEQLRSEVTKLINDDSNYNIFMAYLSDTPIGGIGCKISDRRITEQGLARVVSSDVKALNCIDLLRWNLILFGIEQGCLKYDMGGIQYSTEKQKNIARNKTKWHGEICKMEKYV